MTTSKSPNAYPFEFYELVEKFHADTDRVINILFDTMKEAMTARLQFNSYRYASVKAGLNKEFPNLEAMNLSVKDNPPRIVISHKDNTIVAKAFRKALDALDDSKE